MKDELRGGKVKMELRQTMNDRWVRNETFCSRLVVAEMASSNRRPGHSCPCLLTPLKYGGNGFTDV